MLIILLKNRGKNVDKTELIHRVKKETPRKGERGKEEKTERTKKDGNCEKRFPPVEKFSTFEKVENFK